MTGPALRIEVVPADEADRAGAWRRWLRSRGAVRRSGPLVVAVNPAGERRVLFGESHWDEANAKADRLRRELATEDLHRWCDRYGVPTSFVAG